MSNLFVLPKPRSWETFEDIVADVYARRYQNYNLQRYGRTGQEQYGVDIAGPTKKGMLGIQCKHHPDKKIPLKEINESIEKAESFLPSLREYVITTSASRDADVHSHVLGVSTSRINNQQYPVSIKFWEDICDWLCDYPDLVYKHFTQYFPLQTLEHITLPGLDQLTKQTLQWPCTQEELVQLIHSNLGQIDRVDPYNLFMAISTFREATFTNQVDLEVQLANLIASPEESEANFKRAAEFLTELKRTISSPIFSKDLVLYLQTRLTVAFLVGWTFRRVTHHRLKLVFRGQIWATDDLPYVPSKLYDDFPEVSSAANHEAVLILSITRNIKHSVAEFIRTWESPPRVVLNYSVEANVVRNAAHALSIAQEISHKIKNLVDIWGVHKIHLFSTMPAALATLIGFHLNAICPLSIYYLNAPPSDYRLGGTIHRGM